MVQLHDSPRKGRLKVPFFYLNICKLFAHPVLLLITFSKRGVSLSQIKKGALLAKRPLSFCLGSYRIHTTYCNTSRTLSDPWLVTKRTW